MWEGDRRSEGSCGAGVSPLHEPPTHCDSAADRQTHSEDRSSATQVTQCASRGIGAIDPLAAPLAARGALGRRQWRPDFRAGRSIETDTSPAHCQFAGEAGRREAAQSTCQTHCDTGGVSRGDTASPGSGRAGHSAAETTAGQLRRLRAAHGIRIHEQKTMKVWKELIRCVKKRKI